MSGNEQFSIRRKGLIKTNDVLEVSMSIELQNVPEDLTEIDVSDYARKYSVSYYLDKEFMASVDFETEAGYIPTFDDDLAEYIKENLANDFDEINEYEIFNVNTKEYDYQTAKIKVTSLK